MRPSARSICNCCSAPLLGRAIEDDADLFGSDAGQPQRVHQPRHVAQAGHVGIGDEQHQIRHRERGDRGRRQRAARVDRDRS